MPMNPHSNWDAYGKDFKPQQRVQIAGPRGTWDDAIVLGVTRSGRVLVLNLAKDNDVEVVDREDVRA
jgi:hypothetical protein